MVERMDYEEGATAAEVDFLIDAEYDRVLTFEQLKRMVRDCKNTPWCVGYALRYASLRVAWSLQQGKSDGVHGLTTADRATNIWQPDSDDRLPLA